MKKRPTLKVGDVVKWHHKKAAHMRSSDSFVVIGLTGHGSEGETKVHLYSGRLQPKFRSAMRRYLWSTGHNINNEPGMIIGPMPSLNNACGEVKLGPQGNWAYIREKKIEEAISKTEADCICSITDIMNFGCPSDKGHKCRSK